MIVKRREISWTRKQLLYSILRTNVGLYKDVSLPCGKSSCSVKAEHSTLKEKVDSETTVEATTSRKDHAEANRTAIEKAKEYWPQYVSTHKYLDIFHKPRICAGCYYNTTVLHVGWTPAISTMVLCIYITLPAPLHCDIQAIDFSSEGQKCHALKDTIYATSTKEPPLTDTSW